jgi:hypothetical protein
MALRRVWLPSPNKSSRGGAKVRLIVIHATEGATTYQSLGNWFANPGAQVSSHTGIDNAAGDVIGEYVKPPDKAWTGGNANPVAIQTELCVPSGASAGWSADRWKQHPHMLRKCAAWIAEEAKRYGIPITKLTAGQAQGSGRGVCQHNDLGSWGGNHFDCGRGFPIDHVLNMARGKPAAPPPKQPDDYPAMEAEPMQLEFFKAADGAPRCAVAVPKYYSDGKSRIRFAAVEPNKLRVDFAGKGKTANLTLSYDQRAQGAAIPAGCQFIVVRRDSGTGPVDTCFTRS